jgi:hypothetical protein
MNRVPSPAQPPHLQVWLETHRQHQRPHGIPIRGGQAALDATHRRLRRARTERKRTLAKAKLLAMPTDQCSRIVDIYKYIERRLLGLRMEPAGGC